IESGLGAAQDNICGQDKIWSRYSHDKIDVGEVLAKVIRTLSAAVPLNLKLRALSMGSSDEPQFRILETAFRGGLYLLDINECALNIVRERIKRQRTDHVITIKGDYNKFFLNAKHRDDFFKYKLNNHKIHLVTLHHSLYYSRESDWLGVFDSLYSKFLAAKGAMHAVLMSSKSMSHLTTTWLYNHFAGKFFGVHNDQDLRNFKKKLQKEQLFKNAQVLLKTNRIYFDVDDFKKFMAVVWMILLYPNVHNYSLKQREEITEFVYKKFYKNRQPLIQEQDHLVIYKEIKFKGLI
ncbi:MAG: class I SAM-dependent methyltransferase, partial [Candidatus Omnitrophota bacterium]